MSKVDAEELSPENIVGFLDDIFSRRGGEAYLGEGVTMAEHMLQAAFQAEQQGAKDVLVAAALLHDVGHFTSELGTFSMDDGSDRCHEVAGAKVLSRLFPTVVTECVERHVEAKRYLCATDPKYFGQLSKASVHSLNLQGGPMGKAEIANFGARPYLQEVLRVRRWDDEGKVVGATTPPFGHYVSLLQGIVDTHARPVQ